MFLANKPEGDCCPPLVGLDLLCAFASCSGVEQWDLRAWLSHALPCLPSSLSPFLCPSASGPPPGRLDGLMLVTYSFYVPSPRPSLHDRTRSGPPPITPPWLDSTMRGQIFVVTLLLCATFDSYSYRVAVCVPILLPCMFRTF